MKEARAYLVFTQNNCFYLRALRYNKCFHLLFGLDVHIQRNIDAADQNIGHCQRNDVIIGQDPEALVGSECCTY